MDYQSLVEEITNMVLLHLKAKSSPVEGAFSEGRRKIAVLLDPEMKNFSDLVSILMEACSNNEYKIISNTCSIEHFKKSANMLNYTSVIEPCREIFEELANSSDEIFIPHLSVTGLSKISRLIGDEPLSGVALYGLILGKPVRVCADYIHSLNFSNNSPAINFLSYVRKNLKIIEEMGVKTGSLKEVSFGSGISSSGNSSLFQGSRNVVTNGDIEIAASQKLKVLNFPSGTIVTPLARDTAANLGVEINLV